MENGYREIDREELFFSRWMLIHFARSGGNALAVWSDGE